MKALRLILGNLAAERRVFFISFAGGVIDGILRLQVPRILSEIPERLRRADQLPLFFAELFLITAVSLFFQWVIRAYGEGVGFNLGNRLRLHYFRKVLRLPYRELTKRHSGQTLSLIDDVAENMPDLTEAVLWDVARGLTEVAVFLHFAAQHSLLLAGVNLLVLVAVPGLATWALGKLTRLWSAHATSSARLMQRYTDFMGNILTVRRLGGQAFARRRIAGETRRNTQRIRWWQTAEATRWAGVQLLFSLAMLSTLVLLLDAIAAGRADAAVLIFFIAAYSQLRGLVEAFTNRMGRFLRTGAYAERLDAFLPADGPVAPASARIRWETIELRDVRLRYGKRQEAVRVPSFTLARGERVCVTGASGQGKTTILHAVADLLDPASGTRTLDGRPYTDAGPFFASAAVLVSQDTELFSSSLRSNLTLGRSVPESRLLSLLDEVGLRAWAELLPRGLDTHVGEKGARLSAGQKQRVNMVRAMLLDKEIYLLDEPTSHLDDETEALVVRFLDTHLHGKTAVIVSHRPAIESLCVRKYEMRRHVLRLVRASTESRLRTVN